jgi:pimeloyl-ACP methyl ester carboxylesterase
VWEWPGDDPPLFWAHATGFHGRVWDYLIRQFPHRRSIAVDLRGHGRSAKPAPPYHWREFATDLVAIAELLGVRDSIGIGHSMGGHAIVEAAVMRPETFAALLLVDPTIFPPERYRHPPYDASFVRRRRNHWTAPDEMFERFHNRDPFGKWQPEILRDYCDYGLRASPDGNGLVLACPPDVEASVYEHSAEPQADLYGVIPRISQPVVVMRASLHHMPEKLSFGASSTAPDLARKFPNSKDVVVENSNHYFPMECPDLVVGELRRLATGVSEARRSSTRE